MIANISTPRPGVTEPRDVTRVFKYQPCLATAS